MNLSISNFKKAAVLAAVCILLAVIFYRLIKPQLNNPVPDHPTEAWISDVALMREALYKNKTDESKPTIFIVSGSSSLFGTNSKVIAERTQFNVKNYATHAGLHMDLMFSQIRGKVKAGDIVIAPMEWEVISHDTIRQFDYENYLHHFNNSTNPSTKLKYDIYTAVPLKRWFDGLRAYIFQRYNHKSYTDYAIINTLEKTWQATRKIASKPVYSYLSLNQAGDINILHPMTQQTWETEPALTIPEHLKQGGLDNLDHWRSYFENIGAKFIWTYPPMLDGAGGIDTPQMWGRLKQIRDQVASTSTPLYCDPVKATFSNIYRFDTANHLTADGARLRSQNLADCIEKIIKGDDARTQPFTVEDATAAVKERLLQQKDNFGEGNLPFQIQLRNIAEINKIVKDFYQKNGKYPASSHPGNWGSPLGVALPESSANSAGSNNGYSVSYWSNETSYKLITKAPGTDCPVVFANWPELIDMAGTTNNNPMTCTGYGYWSDDQKLR